MKRKLTITLKSDLCVSSGYSYAGLVDSDVCYDKYGLPYIPARRLKGCFRDTAVNLLYSLIDSEQVTQIFGIGGASGSGAIRVSNAKLKNYENLVSEIQALKNNSETSELFTQQKVLGQYSHIVAQTAIDESGSAEAASLRYTRVIDHFVPNADNNGYEENVFEAVVECAETTDLKEEELEELLGLIVGATKNIGLKRNRGLGAVHCELSELPDGDGQGISKIGERSYEPDEEYVITYSLKNDEPLMLSQLSDIHSEKHISGQSVLGHLVGKYLSDKVNSTESDEFGDLFLNGVTRFAPAYPADITEDGKANIFYPAPTNINRLKLTKEYVDTVFKVETGAGNQPKKLKGKYVHCDVDGTCNRIMLKEVDMKMHYHHRKGEDGILYPSEAIEPGHTFVGEIYTRGKHVNKLVELINRQEFYFGKSKSAQYGHCLCDVLEVAKKTDAVKTHGNSRLIITLLSDAIFMENGACSVEQNVILGKLAERIPGAKIIPQKNKDDSTYVEIATVMMDTGLVSGYQTTWNMHKPLFPIVKAGSCFVLDGTDCSEFYERIWVGTKNQEGYGLASVQVLENRTVVESKRSEESTAVIGKVKAFKPQYVNILEKQLIEVLVAAIRDADRPKGSAAQIGRALLMLKQSKDFGDFTARIKSIKTDKVRESFENKLIKPVSENGSASIRKLVKSKSKAEKCYELLEEVGASLNDKIWREYLTNILTICKYESKEA